MCAAPDNEITSDRPGATGWIVELCARQIIIAANPAGHQHLSVEEQGRRLTIAGHTKRTSLRPASVREVGKRCVGRVETAGRGPLRRRAETCLDKQEHAA